MAMFTVSRRASLPGGATARQSSASDSHTRRWETRTSRQRISCGSRGPDSPGPRPNPTDWYLATLPGIGWITIAGLIAEIGPFHRFRHGRQLVKLAGLQPSRRESGQTVGRTPITKRGRAQLRAVVYMATLSSLRHKRRLKAHYDRLTQRTSRPLPPMQAIGACITKLLHYAFAVVKHRAAFDIDHLWRDESIVA